MATLLMPDADSDYGWDLSPEEEEDLSSLLAQIAPTVAPIDELTSSLFEGKDHQDYSDITTTFPYDGTNDFANSQAPLAMAPAETRGVEPNTCTKSPLRPSRNLRYTRRESFPAGHFPGDR
jgi:hypothetical protein